MRPGLGARGFQTEPERWSKEDEARSEARQGPRDAITRVRRERIGRGGEARESLREHAQHKEIDSITGTCAMYEALSGHNWRMKSVRAER